MVPSFRYHLVTVCAIFLALGVGIVIGSSFVQSAIVDRQTRRLDELKAQFSREIVPLREQNQRYAEFLTSLAPMLLKSYLAKMRIALVQTGDYPDALRKIRDALEKCGATVTNTTLIDHAFLQIAPAKLSEIWPRLSSGKHLPMQTESLLRILAAAIALGGREADLALLEEAKLIMRGGDYNQGNEAIILVGGASKEHGSRAQEVDAPLISFFKAFGVKVVATEPENVAISSLAVLQESGIITIERADTDIGQMTLILSLRNEREDTSRTARSGIFPPRFLPR
jgi:hypothetical protein